MVCRSAHRTTCIIPLTRSHRSHGSHGSRVEDKHVAVLLTDLIKKRHEPLRRVLSTCPAIDSSEMLI